MNEIISQQYKELGIQKNILLHMNKFLKIPNERLSVLARVRRKEALEEALNLKKGLDQKNRIITTLYSIDNFSVAVGKPGKEAAPEYKGCRHYKTHEKTNNPNDMNPCILKDGKKFDKDLTFGDMFERIEKLMHADLFGLELLGSLLFRAAFMLDHIKDEKGNWRYHPPEEVVKLLEKKIPLVSEIPTKIFLYFLEVLALNEDIKVYTLGYDDFKQDYGRINTLLTFVHLIAVLLNRRSLAKFAGTFARPPSGMAPIPKTKASNSFPLLSSEFSQTYLK